MHGKYLHLLQDLATAFCVTAEAMAPGAGLKAAPLPPNVPAIVAIRPAHECWSAEASKLLWEEILEKSRNQPYIGTYKTMALTGQVPIGPV